jgi:predicted phosphodiesterase
MSMRIAIVTDIHGNRTAFEAVLADLREVSPDLVFHGGDLSDSGSSPTHIIDRIRDLKWPGVVGNTDELLFRPESLTEFARSAPQLAALWAVVEEMAAFTRDALGPDRLAWLGNLPRSQVHAPIALVHAVPESAWRSPDHTATDRALESVYFPLGQPVVVYGHTHRSYIRTVGSMTVVNAGSISVSYDGDPRASYVLLDDGVPSVRRVEYDVEQEIHALGERRFPHRDWLAKMLRSASPQMP